MVSRVYVEKKPGFDGAAQQLSEEIRSFVGVRGLEGLRLINRYDVEGISEELFAQCVDTVFSEPQSDSATLEMPDARGAAVFAVEYLPGQFDQRADSASECIQLVSQGERPEVRSARVYMLKGALCEEDVAAVKRYVINPVEAREAALERPCTLHQEHPLPAKVEALEGFLDLDRAGLEALIDERGLAMDLADLVFCQEHFARERRNPSIAEIKVIDTYWSDHCRHTTFGTVLDELEFEDEAVRAAFDRYLQLRRDLGREDEPVCLMDMGTIGARWLKAQGILTGLDDSDEVNACTVRCKVDVDGEQQDWLYLFKNETHNHPTEIEPFGGAATCLGGAIRDPLSGRSYVYQAMRVTGAADPLAPVSETLPGKLSQRKLTTTAAEGYSSYGNQVGLATGQVSEVYHPGYAAKRMEIGAVVGATPADHVRRETPVPGDVIVLLGGRTGRDGIGGATGSSKAHKLGSLESCGAEVQKGNAPVERKMQRLFRRGDACRLVKRCNDFGAGGVSVAVGELADGLLIELDSVPKKYEGLDGTELALSESQERMAVALEPGDVARFLCLAHEENLEATPIATVTEEPCVRMEWRGKTIVSLSRAFLASNGAPRRQRARVLPAGSYRRTWDGETLAARMKALVGDMNVCSNKGLSERFDSSIGAGTVLMPFGGQHQLTPALAMVAKLPVLGETTTVSGMAWGFNPYLSEADPFVGSYAAVVESVAKLVASGFARADMYLSFQEYFERLRKDPERWGKPVAAVLGALMAQIDLGVGAVGGKDSMSGSFEQLDVPPTLVSFATAVGSLDRVTSPEFKRAGSCVVRIAAARYDGVLPEAAGLLEAIGLVERLIGEGRALAVSTPGYGAAAEALFKMCLGRRIGVRLAAGLGAEELFAPTYGSFLVELADVGDCSSSAAAEELAAEAPETLRVDKLGQTTEAYDFVAAGESIDLADLQEEWEGGLEAVFPYRSLGDAHAADAAGAGATTPRAEASAEAPGAPAPVEQPGDGVKAPGVGAPGAPVEQAGAAAPAEEPGAAAPAEESGAAAPVEQLSFFGGPPLVLSRRLARPRVVIPVFPGNNCEYDSARAFERAGAEVDTLIVNNLSPQKVAQSAEALVEAIDQSQIVMIPGGFSGGDEPDGSAKFITAFFRAPAVTEAVRRLLYERDGLMLGVCNGFQALVKLGLVPFGDIRPMDASCPTLALNDIGRHQSRLVRTRVASALSPWLSRCKVGDVHTLPVSHAEGRFVASPELVAQLVAKGQIATQYVDAQGVPSMNLDVNPNGSVLAIESVTSPDGRILGKMAHSERRGEGLYRNVPGDRWQPLFEGGVGYFTG